MKSKKALSPLVATILLVVFALIVGTATMSWGKSYVEGLPDDEENKGLSYTVDIDELDNPLKQLQIRYIKGRISLDEYLIEEQKAITQIKS